MANTIIHVLSVRAETSQSVEAKVTIRQGDPQPGIELHYTAPAGEQYRLRILERNDVGKFTRLTLAGEKEHRSALKSGYYLHASL